MKAFAVRVGPTEQTPWLAVTRAAAGMLPLSDCGVIAVPPAPPHVPAVVPRCNAYLAALLATGSEPSVNSVTSGWMAAVEMRFARGSVALAVLRQLPATLNCLSMGDLLS